MSISLQSRAKGLQRLICFKYYYALKLEIKFTLGLNPAEITDYMKKVSSKSCSKLNFLQKSQWGHMSISPRSGAMVEGRRKIAMFEIL